MERIKPTGVYGYLGGYLLRMASKSDVYVYIAEDKKLAEEYGFKIIRSPFWKDIFYELEAPPNTGIRAFKVCSFAKYQGFDLYIENCDDKMLFLKFIQGEFGIRVGMIQETQDLK